MANPLSRPPVVEGDAAQRAIEIAAILGLPVYIVRVSPDEATAAITRARAAGQRVYGEVPAQHLVIDGSVYWNADFAAATAHVMFPPFRPKNCMSILWYHGIRNGRLTPQEFVAITPRAAKQKASAKPMVVKRV